jgi:hypothetical protein
MAEQTVTLQTNAKAEDITGVVVSASTNAKQGDDSARQIARPVSGGDITEIGEDLTAVRPVLDDVATNIASQAPPPPPMKVPVIDTEKVAATLEMAKATLDAAKEIVDKEDKPKVAELEQSVTKAAQAVKVAADAEMIEDVAKVEVEIASDNKEAAQEDLKEAMKEAVKTKTNTDIKKMEKAKEVFEEAKKEETEALKTLAVESAKKKISDIVVVKEVKEVAKKKIEVLQTVKMETKKIVEQIPTKNAAIKTKPPLPMITPSTPDVIVKTDCDFLKNADLVSEFFLDKQDGKCYGMASATVNGSKHLFAVQCDTTPAGVCPSKLSMDICRVSSLTGAKLADIF